MTPDDGIKWLKQKAAQYQQLNELVARTNNSGPEFVERLKDRNRKSIPAWEDPKNSHSTHKMSWSTIDDKAVIYPMVQNVNGSLIDYSRPPYSPNAGIESAISRGDTIMTTPTLADLYTRHYKKYYKF